MKLYSLLFALLFGLAAVTVACDDGGSSTTEPDPQDVSAILALTGDSTNGAAAFNSTCGNAACHGSDGESGPAADLSAFIGVQSNEQIAKTIKFGQGSMPGQALSDQQIADVLAYLDTL